MYFSDQLPRSCEDHYVPIDGGSYLYRSRQELQDLQIPDHSGKWLL